jgi:hypothetical protein
MSPPPKESVLASLRLARQSTGRSSTTFAGLEGQVAPSTEELLPIPAGWPDQWAPIRFAQVRRRGLRWTRRTHVAGVYPQLPPPSPLDASCRRGDSGAQLFRECPTRSAE